MNVKKIVTLFVISILMFFSGCNSLKRRIVVGQEKVGVEGEDYTLHYYERKIGIRMKQRTRKTGRNGKIGRNGKAGRAGTSGTSGTSGTGGSGE